MKKNIIILLLLLFLAKIYYFYTEVPPVISVKPARTQVFVQPGSHYDGNFLIVNQSDQAIQVVLEAEDWTEIAQGSRIKGMPGWLQFDKLEVSIVPNKTERISYRLALREDANGVKMAQIFFVPSYLDKQTFIKTRMGVIIQAIAQGTEKNEISNAQIEIEPINATNAIAYLSLANTGNTHLIWYAEIKLKDMSGRPKGSAMIRPGKTLLAGQTTTIKTPLENYSPITPDNAMTDIILHYGIQKDDEYQKKFSELATIKKSITN